MRNFEAEQRRIFSKALQFVNHSRGQIVYSTCSVFQQENEKQIDYFLSQFNLDLVEQPFKALPFRSEMDGFYAAILKFKHGSSVLVHGTRDAKKEAEKKEEEKKALESEEKQEEKKLEESRDNRENQEERRNEKVKRYDQDKKKEQEPWPLYEQAKPVSKEEYRQKRMNQKNPWPQRAPRYNDRRDAHASADNRGRNFEKRNENRSFDRRPNSAPRRNNDGQYRPQRRSRSTEPERKSD
jgi:hypothetical protein